MIIVIQCKDQVGLVAAIAGVLAKATINIVSMREHVDTVDNRFFVRIETEQYEDALFLEEKLGKVLPTDATVKVNPSPVKKIIILVTKEYHCLADILIRNYFKTLGASVQCVIGNHSTLQNICERFDVPFHFIPHEDKNKEAFEEQILNIIQQYNHDYIVLAKFMRILSPQFIEQLPLHIINIHHSFLPGFKGAKAYHQAHARGVKLIGATAHYVTTDLDEGPIIEQEVARVDHTQSPEELVNIGADLESVVLNRAVKWHAERRVFVNGAKTVVLK